MTRVYVLERFLVPFLPSTTLAWFCTTPSSFINTMSQSTKPQVKAAALTQIVRNLIQTSEAEPTMNNKEQKPDSQNININRGEHRQNRVFKQDPRDYEDCDEEETTDNRRGAGKRIEWAKWRAALRKVFAMDNIQGESKKLQKREKKIGEEKKVEFVPVIKRFSF